MIEPVERCGRNPKARAVCDGCGLRHEVVCDYEFVPGGKRHRLNEGQAVRKLTAAGWELVKGRLHCPACAKARKREAQKMPKDATVTPIREPTFQQRRDILSLLGEVYDTAAMRYRRGDTDRTVAEAVGDGCMPGWVAEIREQFFGPSGGNEDLDSLRDEVKALARDAEARVGVLTAEHKALGDRIAALSEGLAGLAAFEKRLDVLKASIDPRAARA